MSANLGHESKNLKECLYECVFIYLASFLRGGNRESIFPILIGSGGNGKSILLALMRLSFGKYYIVIPVTTFTKPRPAGTCADQVLVGLKEIRLAVSGEPDEPNQQTHLNTVLITDWTGKDPITGRGLYENLLITFVPLFKTLFYCNKLPNLPPDDEGTWRRITVLEFEARFIDNPNPENPYKFQRDND
jgi:phage/plasmid-associated DNA primase